MQELRDYFRCDVCANKNFKTIYSFSLRFHEVNFARDLIYDKLVDEMYQCTQCKKIFTREQIEAGLAEFRKKRRGSLSTR